MIRRSISVVSASMLLSSCAIEPVSNSQAAHIPTGHVLNTRYSQPSVGTGEVTVKRGGGFLGGTCPSRVFVNGLPVAEVGVSEKVVLYLPEGEHILSVQPAGACGGGTSEVRVVVKLGQPSSFQMGYGTGGNFTIQPTAF